MINKDILRIDKERGRKGEIYKESHIKKNEFKREYGNSKRYK